MLIVVFADANVPGILLSDVQAQRVGSHSHGDPEIAIAEQHTFEEIRCGAVAQNAVAAGDREGVEAGAGGLRCGWHAGSSGAGR